MGKRSNFERIEKDYYRTIDPRAVQTLAPFLKPQTRFCEPCAGAGDLMDQLTELGHVCVDASDIDPQRKGIKKRNAFTFTTANFDCFITNPPWSRPILHKLIDFLCFQNPTWLLFDADWAHTKQSAPYMKYCSDIVSVGRLIWIPGTTTSGKDNCAWYRFSHDAKQTIFHGR